MFSKFKRRFAVRGLKRCAPVYFIFVLYADEYEWVRVYSISNMISLLLLSPCICFCYTKTKNERKKFFFLCIFLLMLLLSLFHFALVVGSLYNMNGWMGMLVCLFSLWPTTYAHHITVLIKANTLSKDQQQNAP